MKIYSLKKNESLDLCSQLMETLTARLLFAGVVLTPHIRTKARHVQKSYSQPLNAFALKQVHEIKHLQPLLWKEKQFCSVRRVSTLAGVATVTTRFSLKSKVTHFTHSWAAVLRLISRFRHAGTTLACACSHHVGQSKGGGLSLLILVAILPHRLRAEVHVGMENPLAVGDWEL